MFFIFFLVSHRCFFLGGWKIPIVDSYFFSNKGLKPPPSLGCLEQRVKNAENSVSQWPTVSRFA